MEIQTLLKDHSSFTTSFSYLPTSFQPNKYFLYLMVRRRADEPVPAMEHGIEEVIIRHRKTKRGVRTTEKSIPVLIPVKDKPGKSSHYNGRQNGQLDPECLMGSEVNIPTINDASFHQCTDEQPYDHPDGDVEKEETQSNVCLLYYSSFIYI
jgi:hypothetical protein